MWRRCQASPPHAAKKQLIVTQSQPSSGTNLLRVETFSFVATRCSVPLRLMKAVFSLATVVAHAAERVDVELLQDTYTLSSGNWLIANFFWGLIGTACAIYGWRQKSAVPLAGGVLLIVATYFLDSALWMSVASVAILGAMYFGRHLGEGAG